MNESVSFMRLVEDCDCRTQSLSELRAHIWLLSLLKNCMWLGESIQRGSSDTFGELFSEGASGLYRGGAGTVVKQTNR
jgi:hypothetical protein